jgi:hypothetical protein
VTAKAANAERLAAAATIAPAVARWHARDDLVLDARKSKRIATGDEPPVVEVEIIAWRPVTEELRFIVDPATNVVISFEDPAGRLGAASDEVKLDRDAADEIVDRARLLNVGMTLDDARLEPGLSGGGVLWRLEYARGGQADMRVEVHPATGAIVGFRRLRHPLLAAGEPPR